jgi:putative phosphoesterase
MLIAFLSDLHGNLPALEAAYADARRNGASRIICAGDLTGYGPFPDEVCRFIQNHHIPAILGNYDQKVMEVTKRGLSAAQGINRKKQKILLWAANHLGKQRRGYLARLPEQLSYRLSGGLRLLVVHGSPSSSEDAIYPSITGQGLKGKLAGRHPDVLVCGHTHIPFVKRVGEILVINCGSAGQPVDGDPRPAYALVRITKGDPPRGRIRRFEYDRDRVLSALEKTSMPKGLRKDFAEGNKRRFLQ